MKKVFLSMAIMVLASTTSVMGQAVDKAAAKAAAAALKAAQKEAKTQVADAQKIKDALQEKMTAKTATEDEIMSESKKAQDLVTKALASGNIDPKKISDAWKLSADVAYNMHNLYIASATNKVAFDTVSYYKNLKIFTDAVHHELETTKVVKGETGNEGYLKAKKMQLAQSGVYYIYAAQFESECKRFDSSIEAYENAMNYAKTYPEVAADVKMPIENNQLAYYAFHTAHEAGNYAAMEKFYNEAMTFADGAKGTQQVYLLSLQEKGDTAAWASKVREICLKEPAKNEDYIQILLAYYQKKSVDEMAKFADDVIAIDDNILIANYAKGFVAFNAEKYDDALKVYEKCTQIKPDYYDAWYQCGLCKYRQALALNATISSIKDQKKAKTTLETTKGLFADAIPYFEKARECAPDEPQKWAYELKQCYTVTGNSSKAAEMDKLL